MYQLGSLLYNIHNNKLQHTLVRMYIIHLKKIDSTEVLNSVFFGGMQSDIYCQI